MKQGRHICNTLKAIRRQIAEANGIKYEPRDCHHEGDCAGTCPTCEAEVRYLEGELNRRSSMGKKVAVAGLAVGMAGLASCTSFIDDFTDPQQTSNAITTNTSHELVGIIEVGQMPSFPGGDQALMDYLKANVRYPEVKDSLDGRVVVSFVVECDGSITDAKVVKSLTPAYDAEALRVVNAMPKWVPGKQDGEAIRTKYSIPFTFRKE
jgi:TonB family protein